MRGEEPLDELELPPLQLPPLEDGADQLPELPRDELELEEPPPLKEPTDRPYELSFRGGSTPERGEAW